MTKVRLVMLHRFYSKFHTFSGVQKFWKSVKIWQSYREFKGGNFFETQCSLRCCQRGGLCHCQGSHGSQLSTRMEQGSAYWCGLCVYKAHGHVTAITSLVCMNPRCKCIVISEHWTRRLFSVRTHFQSTLTSSEISIGEVRWNEQDMFA